MVAQMLCYIEWFTCIRVKSAASEGHVAEEPAQPRCCKAGRLGQSETEGEAL